jgi:hypothetical protein
MPAWRRTPIRRQRHVASRQRRSRRGPRHPRKSCISWLARRRQRRPWVATSDRGTRTWVQFSLRKSRRPAISAEGVSARTRSYRDRTSASGHRTHRLVRERKSGSKNSASCGELAGSISFMKAASPALRQGWASSCSLCSVTSMRYPRILEECTISTPVRSFILWIGTGGRLTVFGSFSGGKTHRGLQRLLCVCNRI